MGTRWTRSWRGRLLVAGMASASVVPSFALGATPGAGAAVVSVIVDGSSSELAADAVRAVGGVVDAPLDLIGGVAAAVPADAVGDLVSAGFLVVPDQTVSPVDHEVGAVAQVLPDLKDQLLALNPGTSGGAAAGAGVTVALIDTGVHPHAELHELKAGVDLSGEGNPLRDGYGHGTFMAGLIAGERTGIAPGAEIVSIKVADEGGSTTLRTLIEGIGWAVVNQDEHSLDILNLSFGTVTGLPAAGDPLVQAVEAAWASGLLVVVAAGNEGQGTVTSPGTSPSALTVGATDHGSTAAIGDDVLQEWSGRVSHPVPKPELVAPGTSLVSLLAEGSTLDDGEDTPNGYRTGTGTSMSTALASGAAAVVLANHLQASPADVKSALVDTGAPVTGSGAGTIDLHAAVTTTSQPVEAAPGQGRAPAAVGSRPGTVTNGWEGARWTGARWTGARWTWSGARWTGARWTAEEWAEQEWAGARWTGARWTGARWTGARWTGTSWTGTSWTMADLEGSEQP